MIKIKLLSKLIALFSYKKILLIAYKKIKKKNIHLLTKINNELMTEDFIDLDEYNSFKIYNLQISFKEFQNSLKQYYFTKLFNYRINKYLMIFYGLDFAVVYPLPKKQLKIINEQ